MKISFSQAVDRLQNGIVIAVPTETVYGLAARVADTRAVRKIFKIKGRPADNPLIVHVAAISQIKPLVKAIPTSLKKLARFWPGPLTVVLSANPKAVPRLVRAGLATVALRVPDHHLMRKLIRKVGPLAAPSANRSGKPSPTRAAHVEADLGKEFPVLDGGVCKKGVESTVIALSHTGWSLLRYGALSVEKIAAVLGAPTPAKKSRSPQAPGMKYRHYAPRSKLVWCATRARLQCASKNSQAVLGFDDSKHAGCALVSMGRRNQPQANLKRLYAALRVLDQKNYKRVAIDGMFAANGLGATLAERLKKAAGL